MPIGYKLLFKLLPVSGFGELELIFRVQFLSGPYYVFKLFYTILTFICIYKSRFSWIINFHNNPTAVDIEK